MVSMSLALSLIISFLALLATFYQAHLQRVHNQKSVKPLAEINLRDRDGEMFVRIANNGVGPLIVDKVVFTKGDKQYEHIQDCLDIDPKTYFHVEVGDTNKKVIIAGGFLELFSNELNPKESAEKIEMFQKQLSVLQLKVHGHDIYSNEITVEKSLSWFARHHSFA